MKTKPFLAQITRRVNKSKWLKALVATGLVFGVLTLLGALSYVMRGYTVPAWVYLSGGVAAVITGGCYYLKTRQGADGAARFADQFFNLKDGVVSQLHLEEKKSPFTELQQKWTEEKLAECKAETIPLHFPKRLAVLAGILCLGGVGMGFIPASSHVVELQEEEALTEERSEEAVKEIKKVVEEMEKDLSEEERKEMDMSDLRKLVDKLEPTKKQEKAARQFAKLEQKAREMSASMQQEKDEATLKKAIKELEKSAEKEGRELAEKLKKDEVPEAREQMKKLMPKPLEKKQLSAESLKKAREEIERLRNVTKKLASESGNTASAQSGASGSGAGSGSGLSDSMNALDANAKDLLQKLKELELQNLRKSQGNCQNFNDQLDKLCKSCDKMCDKLGKMCTKKSCKNRLDSLCKNLSQCQSFTNKQCSSLSLKPCNGLKPGSASMNNKKALEAELPNSGNLSQLKGQKGAGPSLSKVEDAESGSGRSGHYTTAKAQDYERQMESFVQRDDVPEELKQGVKTYFKTIHATEGQE